MIDKFHLTGLEKKYPSQLSGGQKQRTALARIMAYRPDVLLLDEPFSALDAYLKEQLLLELLELLQDYSGDVILVTHSRDEAYKICPELMVVKEGLLVETGKRDLEPSGKKHAAVSGSVTRRCSAFTLNP